MICCDCESPINGTPSEVVPVSDGSVLHRHARCDRPRCHECGWLVARDVAGTATCSRCGTTASATANMRTTRRVPLEQVRRRLGEIGATVSLYGADARGLSEAAVQELEAFAIRLRSKPSRRFPRSIGS